MTPGRRQSGFTLIEVLLVISLVGVLMAFAWPSLSNASEAEHLKESATRMRALISMCRAEAMNYSVRHRILIRLDGSVRVRRQADPIKAPHLYITPRAGWARAEVLMSDVWVEAVQTLPEGPRPIQIIDDKLEFPTMEIDPLPIEEYERAVEINFEPDGASNSLRWILRDEDGHGLLLTLDGRLGRLLVEPWEFVAPADLMRPEPLPDDEDAEDEYDAEDYE